MVKFLNHEALASNLFFEGTSVNTSLQGAWIEQCTMTLPALDLLCERMESDWQKLNPKMRKPWSSRDLDSELMFIFYLPRSKSLCANQIDMPLPRVSMLKASQIQCRVWKEVKGTTGTVPSSCDFNIYCSSCIMPPAACVQGYLTLPFAKT